MGYAADSKTLRLIADLVYTERPDWDPGLLFVILKDLAPYVDGSDLAVAALRAAQNRDYDTPRSIKWPRAHWRDLVSKPPEARELDRCSVCGKVESRCLSERPGLDDDHRFSPTNPSRFRAVPH